METRIRKRGVIGCTFHKVGDPFLAVSAIRTRLLYFWVYIGVPLFNYYLTWEAHEDKLGLCRVCMRGIQGLPW